MRLEHIVWVDSEVAAGWCDGADFDEPTLRRVQSVGWVIGESDDAIVIAAHVQIEDGAVDVVADAMTIPKVAIVRRRRLRE